MKIDRLIGILTVLLQKDKVTAPYLAEKFEVSRRTINRDIEDICKAGIPIITIQGKNGGISIMEGYRIDKTLLTNDDMNSILSALKGLDSVSSTNKYKLLIEKLSKGKNKNPNILPSNEHIMIDLSSCQKPSLSPKIELIQSAISNSKTISFRYFSPTGETMREIEPLFLIFKWSSWYVWGYCLMRNDYRLFKLNRITELKSGYLATENRPKITPDFSSENIFPTEFTIEAIFDSDVKWRLIDDYGTDSFTELENGKLYFVHECSDKYSLFSWLLTFGASVELLEPKHLRYEFIDYLQTINEVYTKKE